MTNLALPPSAWQDNFHFPGLETWNTDARWDFQHFVKFPKMIHVESNLIPKQIRWNVNGFQKFLTGMSCSVSSTMWTTHTRWPIKKLAIPKGWPRKDKTRWRSVGCKNWTHLAFLIWWKIWVRWTSARLICIHSFQLQSRRSGYLIAAWQGPLLSRLPNYCKMKEKLPPMEKVLRLMHLAR